MLDEGRHVTCYCDATIALPLMSHALLERVEAREHTVDMSWLLPDVH